MAAIQLALIQREWMSTDKVDNFIDDIKTMRRQLCAIGKYAEITHPVACHRKDIVCAHVSGHRRVCTQ
jgi:hypothetical protein